MKMKYIIPAVLLLCVFLLYMKITHIPALDENVKATWSQTANEYKRRVDLIPNLVATVKSYATHEEKVLLEVTEARSKATQINVSSELLKDEKKMLEFQKLQADLGKTLSKLLAISESYPNLKADQNFLALQSLEGTENRIAVARRDYIEALKEYNTALRTFPTNFLVKIFYSDLKPIANFDVESHAYEVPKVTF